MVKTIKAPKGTLRLIKRAAAYKIRAQKKEDEAAQAEEDFDAYLQR